MSDQERVLLRGEDVVLRPRAVLTLAMAFHELATNAAKYGALSVSAGRIEIYWQPVRVADHKRSVLRIDWLEKGGPPVTYPRQRSFGSKIEGSIAAKFRWKSQRRFSGERRGLKGGVWHGAPTRDGLQTFTVSVSASGAAAGGFLPK
jgi:two-component sensor histidine kinase